MIVLQSIEIYYVLFTVPTCIWRCPILSAKSDLFTKMAAKFDRGSYMSAHVLLNLLNELGKRDKMRGLQRVK